MPTGASSPLCDLCGRPVADNAYVCDRCAKPVADALRELAIVAGEAAATIARQARLGAGGNGSEDEPLLFSWEAADATWAVANTLTTWARHIAEERGIQPPARLAPIQGPACRLALSCKHGSCTTIGAARGTVHPLTRLSTWLADQIEWLRHRPEAVEALDELLYAAQLAARTVDNPPDRWYAGQCDAQLAELGQESARCTADLYARTGARTVRCGECGTVHDADARRDWLLDLVRDQLATAAWLANTITRLGHRVTANRVRLYAHRGRIVAHGVDLSGHPTYRLGDVLDLVKADERRVALRDLTRSTSE